jgi:hypothetical protein
LGKNDPQNPNQVKKLNELITSKFLSLLETFTNESDFPLYFDLKLKIRPLEILFINPYFSLENQRILVTQPIIYLN